jgi:phosphatidylinositol glycan class V
MLTTAVVPWNNLPPLHYYVCAGIVFSNACHLLSVFALYRLANMMTGHQGNSGLPYVASILYIVSPAGMFLSAPYAESLFALLNFTGMLLYGRAKTPDRRNLKPTIGEDSSVVASAILFVLATWVRSNGILSGLLYLFDAVICLLGMQRGENEIRRLIVTCVSGALLGIGAMIPQYVAYRSYCVSDTGSSARPWCYKPLPSIYTWVQSHYWLVLLIATQRQLT